MNQANPNNDLHQQIPASEMKDHYADRKVRKPSSEADKVLVSEQNPPADIVRDTNHRSRRTTGSTSSLQSKSPPQEPSTRYHAMSVTESPGLLTRITGMFLPNPASNTTMHNSGQQQSIDEAEIERLQEVLHEKDNFIKQHIKQHQRDVDSMQEKLQSILDDRTREWDIRQKESEHYIQRIYDDQDKREGMLQAEIHEIASDRNRVQQQYDELVRKQQESSFKRMESARWLPSEGRKVVGDLDRIKREMKGWAKGTATKEMSFLQKLDAGELSNLMKELSCVVLIENNELPKGLSTAKSPSLLLNALLAHDIYTNLFQNPFFFLRDELGHDLPRAGLDTTLNKIYQLAEASNQQDAHIWRSQTLRLLLPPSRTKSTKGEEQLHSWTEGLIVQVSERQASRFIASSARNLITENAPVNAVKKLKDIYREAATVSYQLWTRRTNTKCITLCEMGRPTFDPESGSLVPHTLVRYDDHKDKLRGKPITVIVHPLLQVFGTDEGEDYDQGTVWAPAEVWLDSKVSPAA